MTKVYKTRRAYIEMIGLALFDMVKVRFSLRPPNPSGLGQGDYYFGIVDEIDRSLYVHRYIDPEQSIVVASVNFDIDFNYDLSIKQQVGTRRRAMVEGIKKVFVYVKINFPEYFEICSLLAEDITLRFGKNKIPAEVLLMEDYMLNTERAVVKELGVFLADYEGEVQVENSEDV